jgi:Ser/Thr protein kinase RdoA (MazF antagonist)
MSPVIPADPAFPHRDVLLDANVVGAYLSSRLAWAGVTRAERVRTTYRVGESLRTLHRFHANGQVHDVAVRAFRAGRSERAFAKALAAGEAANADVVHGEPFEAVFWLFPSDRRVPALKRIERARELLSPRLPRPWTRSRLVTWAPENRATFECLDAAGAVLAYAKVGPGSQTELDLYRALADALAATGAPLRVPRAIAYSSEHETILIEAISGQRLAYAPDDMRGMGRALAHLHRLPLGGLPPFERCAAASRRAAVDLVARAAPRLRGPLDVLAAALDAGEREDLEYGCLHGDVHPKNAIVDAGLVTLIDVEEMAWGARAADLGSLLARLRSARLLELETPDAVRRAAAALLEGYAAVAPLPDEAALSWHLAAAMLVERAQRAVTRLNETALRRLDRIVAEGIRLARGGDL